MTKAWLWRVALRGIAIGTGMIALSFLSGVLQAYGGNWTATLHRAFEFRRSDLDLSEMIFLFAMGFAAAALYEFCWATRQKPN